LPDLSGVEQNPKSQAPNPKQKKGKVNSFQQNTADQNSLEL